MDGVRSSDRTTIWLVSMLVAPIVMTIALRSYDTHARFRAEIAIERAKSGANAKVEDLRDKVDAQQETITVGLGLLGIMVAVGGLLLPIWTHMASIGPGQRLMEEARQATKEAREAKDGLDQRFLDMTAALREKEIDDAIADLGSVTPRNRDRALEHLLFRARAYLTEKQVFDVAAAARATDDEKLREHLTVRVLSDYQSPYVASVLGDLLLGPRAQMYLETASEHCDGPHAAAVLHERIKQYTEGRPERLKDVLPRLIRNAEQFASALMNDVTWLSKFTLLHKLAAVGVSRNVESNDVLYGSALFAEVKGIKKVFSLHESESKQVTPAEANVLLVYDDGRKVGHFRDHTEEFREAVTRALAEGKPDPVLT